MTKKLLQNNAEGLIDPDIARRYNLDLVTSGSNVYHVTKRSEPDKNGKTKIKNRSIKDPGRKRSTVNVKAIMTKIMKDIANKL